VRRFSPILPSILSLKNPSKPNFNHYLFEAISVLIRHSVAQNPSILEQLEQLLFPIFTPIFTEDVAGKTSCLSDLFFERNFSGRIRSVRSSNHWLSLGIASHGPLVHSRCLSILVQLDHHADLLGSKWKHSGLVSTPSGVHRKGRGKDRLGETGKKDGIGSKMLHRCSRPRLWESSNVLSLNRKFTITKDSPFFNR
jgi:hypothetical protein